MSHTAYIRRETLVSMVINGVLSLAFFIAVFGRTSPVALWGMGHWVFDFIPQSFMIALMSTLVPGALTAKLTIETPLGTYKLCTLAAPYLAGVAELLLDPLARRTLRTPGPYLMALAFCVVIAPNAIWLVQSDFLPFQYVTERARVGNICR